MKNRYTLLLFFLFSVVADSVAQQLERGGIHLAKGVLQRFDLADASPHFLLVAVTASLDTVEDVYKRQHIVMAITLWTRVCIFVRFSFSEAKRDSAPVPW